MFCSLFLDSPILTSLCINLMFRIGLFVEMIHDNLLAQVSLPSAEEINEYKAAFGEWHPLLHDCWVTMDGLKLHLQQAGNVEIQEQFLQPLDTRPLCHFCILFLSWWNHSNCFLQCSRFCPQQPGCQVREIL
jgi:hypothetical protein